MNHKVIMMMNKKQNKYNKLKKKLKLFYKNKNNKIID